MKHSTYFVQECPTCGRALQVRVEYLGRQLTCQHCRGKILAQDPEDNTISSANESLALIQRAVELLNQSKIA